MRNPDNIVLVVLMIGIFLTYCYRIYVETITFHDGAVYVALTDQIKEVKKQNLMLEDQMLQYSSLGYIDAQARREGFIDAKYMNL